MPVEAVSVHASPMMGGLNALGLPEVTGWQSIPMQEHDASRPERARSNSRKSIGSS